MDTKDRISHLFSACKDANRAAFIGYVCACDPDFDTSLEICRGLIENGVGICHGEILRVVLRVTKQARLEPWPPARRTSSARPNRAHRKGEDPAHCLKSRNHALE